MPSLHDAKAACLIAKLHREGLTQPWHELTEDARALNAARREYDLHQSHYERNQNRLEAYLSRHWPEVLALFDLDSVTLEKLLIAYGSPQAIAADADQAARHMQAWGGNFLGKDKIARVIASAGATLGLPCIDAVYALRVNAVTCKSWRPKCSTAVANAKRPNNCWKPALWPMPGLKKWRPPSAN